MSSVWLLWVESCEFSQAEKERTVCKAEQIHNKTTIFTQKYNLGPILVKNTHNSPKLKDNHWVKNVSVFIRETRATTKTMLISDQTPSRCYQVNKVPSLTRSLLF